MIDDGEVRKFYAFLLKQRATPTGGYVVAREYRAYKRGSFNPQELGEIIARGTEMGLWQASEVPGLLRLVKT